MKILSPIARRGFLNVSLSALAFALLTAAPDASAQSGPRPGQPAPEIDGKDLAGQPLKLSSFKGKVVLLDFWGDW